MESYAHPLLEDPLFGTVTVALDHGAGTLVVDGDRIPRVRVRRADGAEVDVQVPIGTRDPERLAMDVGGTEVGLRPAKGFLTRRSYRVDVGDHRFVPVSVDGSRLSRGGAVLGLFVSSGDGRVSAQWEGGRPEAYDAAVGYALAAAFGTGAEPMWKLTLDAVLELWP
ncbi:hypothetical protein [Streptomyces sp. NRRL F-2664]|uniref:hypothetical protein n=1 Tax=Streptomyces sp. NRRL F-2664 TaxID=1463842 RepID=UPI0004C5775F|nr:hypothetical protein [Streptomyces sp. NRRL F-2664]